MMLPAGARLGPYEVLSPLGAGGMGEVYCARDTRLNRTVALKLLPTELRDRPDRRQRFDLEARAISSLQHPHICALFDVGEQDGTAFFVMEYLEGETLDDRLIRGALPPKDVLLYAAQIADALDHAHRAHVVHRDLKPSNIMLTSSGAKLLDFGLARNRAVEVTASTPTVTVSPDRLTSEGTILGTFQYMAPEQLEGKDADARTDLFALGTVIYEMATGKKAFEGTSQASLIAAILTGQPTAISAARPDTLLPPALDHVVERCLAKHPDERWQTARDVKMELQWIAGESAQRPRAAASRVRPRTREVIAWAVAAVALVLAAGALLTRRPEPSRDLLKSIVALPAGTTVALGKDFTTVAVSPDGRKLAFVAITDGKERLWIQSSDEATPRRLDDTESGVSPFWSPTGQLIGFFDRNNGSIKKIDPAGGPARLISAARLTGLPVWNHDNTILFSEFGKGISRVSADGGEITSVTQKQPGELNHYWPSMLPDGKHFLYTATVLGPNGQRATPIIYVGSLDAAEPRKEILREHSRMIYTSSGHVLYVRQAALLAQTFDVTNLRLTGEPVTVAEGLDYYRSTGLAGFAVSDAGVLAYHGGTGPIDLVWFDRQGTRLGTLGGPMRVAGVRISPSGAHAMLEIVDPKLGTADLQLHDLARPGSFQMFTNDPNDEGSPVWSPDGQTVLFRSDRGTGKDAAPDFFTKGLDGAAETAVFVKPGPQFNEDWSRTGLISYAERNPQRGRDIWLLSLPKQVPELFVDSSADEFESRFSPSGEWIAYVSNATSTFEVYLKALTSKEPVRPVSQGGGMSPRWRSDGSELFYLSGDGNFVMRVAVKFGTTLELGPPTRLFATGGPTSFRTVAATRVFDVMPDGKRFLIGVTTSDSSSRITVVRNWTTGLAR